MVPYALLRALGRYKKASPIRARLVCDGLLDLAEAAVDRSEHTADLALHDAQHTYDNNSDQNEDQRVLDQALAVFLREKAPKHCRDLLSDNDVVVRRRRFLQHYNATS